MKIKINIILFFILINCKCTTGQSINLTKIGTIESTEGVTVKKGANKVTLQFDTNDTYSWCSIPLQIKKRDALVPTKIEASINNLSKGEQEIMLWVCGEKGWYSISDVKTVVGNTKTTFSCNLKETFPDGTYKLLPNRITDVKLMLKKPLRGAEIELSDIKLLNYETPWKPHLGRLEIPNLENTKPVAGKRVKFQLSSDLEKTSNRYSVLFLPENWKPHKKYPIIVEFPGNIYYTKNCYSTGEPEQCQIGYGMSKGKDAIWISMPFVNYTKDSNIKNGWGNPDDTADYTLKTVKEVVEKFNGDINNTIITGFSRGAIACRFIGLRNQQIASLWKGFHECQHYDGDGWKGADYKGAEKRLKRLNNRPIFQTDNNREKQKELLKSENVIYTKSNLKFHATTMFLDDRKSTKKLREWYKNIMNKD